MTKYAFIVPNGNKRVGQFSSQSANWPYHDDTEGEGSFNDAPALANAEDQNKYEELYLESLNIGASGVVNEVKQYSWMSHSDGAGSASTNFYVGGWMGGISSVAGGGSVITGEDIGLTKTAAQLDDAYVRLQASSSIPSKKYNRWQDMNARIGFTPGYMHIIRPNGDGGTSQWINFFSIADWECIDDEIIKPSSAGDAEYMYSNQPGSVGEIEFTSAPNVSNVSSITLWLRAKEFTTAPNVSVNVYCGGLLGAKSVAWTTSWAWYSYIWPGLTCSQADLDGLYMKLTAGASSLTVSVATAYIEVIYEPNVVADRLNDILGPDPTNIKTIRYSRAQQYPNMLFNDNIHKTGMSWNGVHLV